MRSASGALMGDRGGTASPGGAAACVVALKWNEPTDTVGAVANALPSLRSPLGPAANAMRPLRQQLEQLPTKRASNGASGEVFASLTVGRGDAAAP